MKLLAFLLGFSVHADHTSSTYDLTENAYDSDFEIAHCNNPRTDYPELKIKIKQRYYEKMLDGRFNQLLFEQVGVWYEAIVDSDLLEVKFDDDECKFCLKHIFENLKDLMKNE